MDFDLTREQEMIRKEVRKFAQSEIDPVVAKTGEISSDLARRVVGMRYTMEMFMPVRQEAAAVYQRVIDANRIEKLPPAGS